MKEVRNETSRLITKAKENYFSTMGRKLCDPDQGMKDVERFLKDRLTEDKGLLGDFKQIDK